MDINTDILIIGSNLCGLLSSYIFADKNIDIIIVESEKVIDIINKQSEYVQIENEHNQLLSLLNIYQTIDFFKMSLEGIYKLNSIVTQMTNDCEFRRKPSINFKIDKINREKYLTFPFIYKSGTTINTKKLIKELLNYLKRKNISIHYNLDIVDIEIIKNKVKVLLNNGNRIECKKLLVCKRNFSELYFNLPKKHDINSNYSIINTRVYKDIFIGVENSLEYKYYISPIIKYHINTFFSSSNRHLPYIDIHDIYPQVYFNVSNRDILSSIIGAEILRNNYLGKYDKRLKIYKLLG